MITSEDPEGLLRAVRSLTPAPVRARVELDEEEELEVAGDPGEQVKRKRG